MELQPQVFVEISKELARLKGIVNRERINVASVHVELVCNAIVTKHFKPFIIGSRTVHQVGLPWHYGWR